jgi:hypothetical protein
MFVRLMKNTAMFLRHYGNMYMFCRLSHVTIRLCTIHRVPDPGRRSRVIVFVGAGCWENLRRDAGNFEWGGDGEELRMGRLVHEYPGTKVDGILSHQGGFPSK